MKKKRFGVVFLSLIIALTAINYVSASSYDDISGLSVDYRDAVNYVSDNNIMIGTSETTFVPFENINRAMNVVILYRLAGKPAVSGSIPFSDVSSESYYYDAVKWAYKNKIVQGTSSTTFSPDSNVTREQFFTFLYRYTSFCNYPIGITNGTSILNAGDYHLVSDYAVNPLRWAVDKHIISRESDTEMLHPQSNVQRMTAALYVSLFGENVEGVKFEKDNFGFTNNEKNFTNNKIKTRYMSDSDYEIIKQWCDSGSSSAASAKNALNSIDVYKEDWRGSCYGMTTIVALDKVGKIGFNENLENKVSSMYQIPKPISKPDEILSRINLYELSYLIPIVYGNMNTYGSSHISDGYKDLVSAVKKNGFVVFNYFWRYDNHTYGHSILIYRCETKTNGDYLLYAYNPNANHACTYTISKDYTSSNFCSDPLTAITLTDSFSAYDVLDYDGIYNDQVPSNSTNESAVTTIALPLSQGNCKITNAEGESLSYDADTMTVDGTMSVYNVHMTFDSIYIEVDNSDFYSFYADTINNGFRIMNETQFVNVEGDKLHDIDVYNDGTVLLKGEGADFKVAIDKHEDNNNMLEISAHTPGKAYIGYDAGVIHATGVEGKADVIEYNDNGTYSNSLSADIHENFEINQNDLQ